MLFLRRKTHLAPSTFPKRLPMDYSITIILTEEKHVGLSGRHQKTRPPLDFPLEATFGPTNILPMSLTDSMEVSGPATAFSRRELGLKLRASRLASGQTLKEIARESGLSVGFIERDRPGVRPVCGIHFPGRTGSHRPLCRHWLASPRHWVSASANSSSNRGRNLRFRGTRTANPIRLATAR